MILNIALGRGNFDKHLAIIKGLSPEYRQWDSKIKKWRVSLNPETIEPLRGIANLDGIIRRYEENQRLEVERKKLSDVEMNVGASQLRREYPFLYPYQAVGAHYAITRKKFLIGDECGTGKTICVLPLIDKVVKSGERVLILCPSSIGSQWASEIKRFIGLDSCVIIKKTRDERIKHYNSSAQIIITTYESFRNDVDDIDRFDCIIADEASRFKNRTSGIYKTMKKVSRDAEYFIALTATPIENGLQDIFHIISILSPNFMSLAKFRERYVVSHMGRFGEVVDEYKNLSNFLYIVSNFFIRRRKCDIAKDMPPLVVQNRIIELSPTQKRYLSAIKQYARENDAMGALMLLHMVGDDTSLIDLSSSDIASTMRKKGLLPRSSPDKSNKIPELMGLLPEIEGQILIFTQYKKFAHMIHQNLIKAGYKAIVLTGDNTQKEREQGLSDMKSGKFRILTCTEILGYGANMQHCSTEINTDLPWNPAKLQQRYGRIHRQGNNKPKLVINFLSNGTDTEVWKILSEKQDLFDKIVDGEVIADETMRKRILQKLL